MVACEQPNTSPTTSSDRLCRNPNNTATTAVNSGNTCGRPTGGCSHSTPTTSRTRPTSSASCPARSPVIRSQRGGCPSITVVHTTEVIYPRAAAASDRDTSQVDHDHPRTSPNVTRTPIDQLLNDVPDAPTRGRAMPTRPPHHRPQHRTCRCCGITSDGIVTEIPRIP